VLEQVGMKQVFCRGFVPYVLNIENKAGELLYMNEGTSGGFKEVILK
jgi:hypothetical protein